jgi:hypothetical protein
MINGVHALDSINPSIPLPFNAKPARRRVCGSVGFCSENRTKFELLISLLDPRVKEPSASGAFRFCSDPLRQVEGSRTFLLAVAPPSAFRPLSLSRMEV